jgi:hypothetical protein
MSHGTDLVADVVQMRRFLVCPDLALDGSQADNDGHFPQPVLRQENVVDELIDELDPVPSTSLFSLAQREAELQTLDILQRLLANELGDGQRLSSATGPWWGTIEKQVRRLEEGLALFGDLLTEKQHGEGLEFAWPDWIFRFCFTGPASCVVFVDLAIVWRVQRTSVRKLTGILVY